ncbi:hypothetical protein NRIC_04930 [Enterococcus florum]|uniref:Uncharacterized protein n=1 Tax=Enterococcus florum TaxID=2480627 RepID=A0A4P5PAS5_9ENTE|nr:DUF6323 family protein [Enterococcus florum]GCF92602.1 hypothetical protein NRIC_04930 [Enterococcus florum]
MEDFALTLFKGQQQLVIHQVNQTLKTNRQSFSLSVMDVEELLEHRKAVLEENYLIDFSLKNTIRLLMRTAAQERFTKQEYLQKIEDLQEVFYYLHSLQFAEDEVLMERIFEVYHRFEGDVEYLKGYFEDNPQSAGGGKNE